MTEIRGMFDHLRVSQPSPAQSPVSGMFDHLRTPTSGVTEVPKGGTPQEASMQAGVGSNAVDFMTGYTRSILGQGVGVGFGDEVEAGIRAGVAKAGGDERDITEIYGEQLEGVRGGLKEFQKEHPVIAGGAELAGAIVPAIATRGRSAPASLARATGRAAMEGAAYGGAYGFGTGEGQEERLNQGMIGSALGGAVGLATSPLAYLATQAARPIGRFIRGAINPEGEAGRRVAQSIATDQQRGASTLTDQQFVQAERQFSQPVTNIERGGETTRALARSAANQSPQARDTLNRAIDPRLEGQGDRITSFTRNLVGGQEASTTREALQTAARRANRPAYARAYSDGDQGIWTPELERLSGSPDVLQAMKSAATTGKSRAVSEGFGAFNPGVKISETGVVNFTRGRQGAPTYPNLQYWDYVKRELDDASNAARRAGRNEEAARISGQAQILRDELDRAVPSYRQAREGAAAFFGAQDALEAGQNFINRRVDMADARRAISRMSTPDRQLFAEGFTDSLIRQVEQTRDRANVVNRIFGSQDARNRIRVALGPQRAQELEAFLRVEGAMDLVRSAVQGNSTTTRQLVELGLVTGSGAGYSLGTGDPTTILMGLLYAGGRAGQIAATRAVGNRISNRVAEMLASNDPTVYLQGIRRIANTPRLMNRLRQIGFVAGAGAAQQGASASGE